MTFVFVVVVLLKESVPHLDLFDGILYNLLKEKWKYACRYRFDTKDNVNVYIRQCKRERDWKSFNTSFSLGHSSLSLKPITRIELRTNSMYTRVTTFLPTSVWFGFGISFESHKPVGKN